SWGIRTPPINASHRAKGKGTGSAGVTKSGTWRRLDQELRCAIAVRVCPITPNSRTPNLCRGLSHVLRRRLSHVPVFLSRRSSWPEYIVAEVFAKTVLPL